MLQPIKRETQAIGILGIALLIVAAIGIHQFTHLNAGQWYLFAMALWMFVGWQLWRRLDLNRVSAQDALYPTLGLANHLSILRGGLIALTGGFLFQPQATGLMAWIPGVLYCIAAILDRMDGYVARRSKHTSLLGNELDTVYDALGLLVAPLLAVGYGKLHWSFLLVSAAYYVFVWGLYWRRMHHLPVYPLMPSMLRRTLAGFQMGFVAFILLPCFHAPLTMIIGIAFMLPILLGFIVDWLIVSGRIPATATTQQAFNHLVLFSHNIFQPLLRASVLIATVLFIFNGNSLSSIWASGLLIIAGATLVGLVGRVCALALLVLITLLHGDKQIDGIITVIIFSSVWLMLLGTGRFSLWQWDDRWVNRRDGEEQS
ncbi:CDP-alcohol phosphatidyltransferase family protein [Cellvibrio fibrivorans]|uniref:CDP-diacylglycerol--glycerol-3-phosphate 3-phosphatidyltransferase n=1 Tax=Cellvibrio fibrivorans TaxID=126350 RepID=A0ABU1UYJ0_9GAMM|nr:CDP-alcohol phosphatidyltransferase family protein [Cellvibrio fibrivorans]MDR7090220.1 CDP-diacylglycerol--glycerol-3-phosphate 3-phosphatidyltransferase [Cellvibrio fibrivorans]